MENMMDFNVELLQWFMNLLIKIFLVEQINELYKPVIRKFDKRKVQPPIEDIWGSDIADM